MLTGENGVLNRVAEAKEKTEKAQKEEEKTLQGYEDMMAQYTGKLPSREETKPYLPSENFKYKEGDLNTGLVIQDSIGNEYVWVEVPKTEEVYKKAGVKITNFTNEEYSKIRADLKEYTKKYNNSNFGDTNSNFTVQYQNMLRSVYINGGFWIGRYEAGYEIDESKGETVRYYGSDYSTEHPITQKVVIKKNAYPYNWVRRDQAQTLANGMNYEGVTSSLMFGLQWDLVLKYIEEKTVAKAEETNKNTVRADIQNKLVSNSTPIGNYYNNLWKITNVNAKYSTNLGMSFTACPYQKNEIGNVLVTTGADEKFSLINIYDIAGNLWEWTLEFYDYTKPCVVRGTSYNMDGSYGPVNSRGLRY